LHRTFRGDYEPSPPPVSRNSARQCTHSAYRPVARRVASTTGGSHNQGSRPRSGRMPPAAAWQPLATTGKENTMRTVRQALLAALALILIGGPTSAARAQQERSGAVAGGEMLRIDFESRAPLSQGDTAGCGPVSLLNLLKLGDPAYRRA